MKQVKLSNLDSPDFQEDADEIRRLLKSSRVLAIVGAGISRAAGLPDFRSKNGVFDRIMSENLDIFSGEDLLSVEVFQSPSLVRVFYKCIAEMVELVKIAKPAKTHAMLQKLHSDQKLLRVYSQNIDNLEYKAGLPVCKSTVVLIHGDINFARCSRNKRHVFTVEGDLLDHWKIGESLNCPTCEHDSAGKASTDLPNPKKRRRWTCPLLRPNILLYGETHPNWRSIEKLMAHDVLSKPSLVLIMGTTLHISTITKFVQDLGDSPIVVVNLEPVVPSRIASVVDFEIISSVESFWEWIERRV